MVTSNGPKILGLPSLQELKLVTIHCLIQRAKCAPLNDATGAPATPPDYTPINSTRDLMEAYPEQFDQTGNFAGEYHIVLRPNNHPIIHAPRKCPIHMRDEIKTELDEMVSQWIIQKVDEPTDWVNSIVYVRKSNGKLRVCLHRKDLIKNIMRCHHKTPTMEKLSGAKFFSKLDAKNGYLSVKLDRESQLLITFISPFGRYCFKRMPFVLVMSHDVFQQKMDMIIEKCPGALALIDNVIVHGKTKKEHDHNLRKLMETARTAGLTFNSSKCAINQIQIRLFGAIFDESGIHPDPQKVDEIKSLPSPTNITELQKVLGIITYMTPFISRLLDLTANLRELLKKDANYEWSSSHQKSLQEIKDFICKEMLLRYYDPSKKSTIQVDASSRGLGAALIQEGKPIPFASKSLNETEQRYANIERELLAVVFGCERFRTYIYSCSFEVESDHKPLGIICLKNLTAAHTPTSTNAFETPRI